MLDLFPVNYALFMTLQSLDSLGLNKNIFGNTLDEGITRLQKTLPASYFPDIYMEAPLSGNTGTCCFYTLDPQEYMLLNYETEGSFFKDTAPGIADLSKKENFGLISGYYYREGEVSPYSFPKKIIDTKALWEKLQNEGENHTLETLFPYLCQESGTCTREAEALLRNLSEYNGELCVIQNTPECLSFSFIPSFLTGPQDFMRCASRRHMNDYLLQHHFADDRVLTLNELPALYEIPCDIQSSSIGKDSECLGIFVGYYRFVFKSGEAPLAFSGVKATTKLAPAFHGNTKSYMNFQWHITELCDQRCRHCYLFAEDKNLVCHTTPFDDLIKSLNNLTGTAEKYGFYTKLTLTGGDPILHPQFWAFAEELHRRGILWSILGNPFHITEETAEKLHYLGCESYQLSLDGLEEFHDSLRKPGSYKATLKAAGILMKAGIYTSFMATASKENLQDILAAMDVAADLKVNGFTFARYCATNRENAVNLYPSPLEYRDFLYRYYKKAKEYAAKRCRTEFLFKEHLLTLLRWELKEFEVPKYSLSRPDIVCDGCHLGQNVTVLADGGLMACRRMGIMAGNIATDFVYDIIEGKTCQALRNVDDIEGCGCCELKNWCRGCRAVGYKADGNIKGRDPMCWYDPVNKKFLSQENGNRDEKISAE